MDDQTRKQLAADVKKEFKHLAEYLRKILPDGEECETFFAHLDKVSEEGQKVALMTENKNKGGK